MTRRRRLLIAVPLLVILASAIFVLLPPGPDGPTGTTQPTNERAPGCAAAAEPSSDHPQTITVQPGGKIQAAVDAAHPGDTIIVSQGIYNEAVIIKQNNITLRGQLDGGTRPILDGANQLGNGVIACGDH